MTCPNPQSIVENGCMQANCRHNVFWVKLGLNKRAGSNRVSRQFHNCMCLFDKDLTLDKIGAMWGLSRERVRQIERNATIKLLSHGIDKDILEAMDIDHQGVKRKLIELKGKRMKGERK